MRIDDVGKVHQTISIPHSAGDRFGLTKFVTKARDRLRMEAALKLLNRNSLGTSRACVEAPVPIGSTNVGRTPV